jgi:hypothetical protein
MEGGGPAPRRPWAKTRTGLPASSAPEVPGDSYARGDEECPKLAPSVVFCLEGFSRVRGLGTGR